WQVLALEECAGRGGGRGNGRLGIAKLRLPLSGGQDGALVVDEFEKIELLLGGECARFAWIAAAVGGGAFGGCDAAIEFERDALYGFAGGNRIDLAYDVVGAALEFGAKLGGDGIGAVQIGLLERS